MLEEKPDVVVDVVDASNIERNLYLGTQFIEMNVPLVFAFNMSDLAKRRGLEFDLKQLSDLLEARIVPTVGSKGEGRDALLDAIIETAREGRKTRIHRVGYGGEIEEELARVESAVLAGEKELADKYGSRWVALKLLEQDDEILAKVRSGDVLDVVNRSVGHLRSIFHDEPEIVLADRRYGFISGACQETIKNSVERRHDVSDMIDAVVTHQGPRPADLSAADVRGLLADLHRGRVPDGMASNGSSAGWARGDRQRLARRIRQPAAAFAAGGRHHRRRRRRRWSFCRTFCCCSWPSRFSKTRATWPAPRS